MASLMSCTNPCVFCRISYNFVFGGRSSTLLLDHGTMSPRVWTHKSNSAAAQDEGEDEAEVCALCCTMQTPRC